MARKINLDKKMVFYMLAQEFEGGEEALKRVDKADLFLLCLDRLRSEIGNVLRPFSELGVKRDDWAHIARESVLNGSNDSNPQHMDENNYLELLEMLEQDTIRYIKNPCHAHDHH